MTQASLRVAPVALALALLASPAPAQPIGYSHLTYVGPNVILVSEDEEESAASRNTPIVPGDRLVTDDSSRAEALLADGAVLRLDAGTSVRFERLARTFGSEDDETLVTLLWGALAVEVRGAATPHPGVRVDTEDATVRAFRGAFVRIDAGDRGTVVTVRSGSAGLDARAGVARVRPGATAYVKAGDPIEVAGGDLPTDDFTRFLDERRPREKGTSWRFLKHAASELGQVSEDDTLADEAALLDEAGSWVYVNGRACFCPRVRGSWRPYSSGYWRWTPAGLTWVADEPWGWMPSHFGTWIYDEAFGWCWCPDWDYAPAWVYWSFTDDWVGWCPSGYYGGEDSIPSGGSSGGGRFEPNTGRPPRGRVDVTRVDPRGWSYAPAKRIGARLDRNEIVRADRAGFRPGDVAVIKAGPIRVERSRGAPVGERVLEFARDVSRNAPSGSDAGSPAAWRAVPRPAPASPGTSITPRAPRPSPPPRVDPEPAPRFETVPDRPAESRPVERPRPAPAEPRFEPAPAPRVEPAPEPRIEPPPEPHFEPAPPRQPDPAPAPPEPHPEPAPAPRFEPAPSPPAHVEPAPEPHFEPAPPRAEPPPAPEPRPAPPPHAERG